MRLNVETYEGKEPLYCIYSLDQDGIKESTLVSEDFICAPNESEAIRLISDKVPEANEMLVVELGYNPGTTVFDLLKKEITQSMLDKVSIAFGSGFYVRQVSYYDRENWREYRRVIAQRKEK